MLKLEGYKTGYRINIGFCISIGMAIADKGVRQEFEMNRCGNMRLSNENWG